MFSMEATSSILSPKFPHNPTRYQIGLSKLRLRNSPMTVRSKKDGYGRDFGRSRLVDENMVVLRKRIDEMRAAERVDPDPATFDWAEWEKDYYEGCYGSDVCEVVGLIQIALMRTRPGVAIGLVAIMMLSVPTSMTLVGLHLVDALRCVLN